MSPTSLSTPLRIWPFRSREEKDTSRKKPPSPDQGDSSESLPANHRSEHEFIQAFFADRHGTTATPLATDRFIERSKESYPSPWLCRELVQNFVDHNPEEPGTLNGVELRCKGKNNCEIEIRGNWSFDDPTGLLTLHSEKPEGRHSAGGNAIGLKQVVLRYLRDFNVSSFEIQGNGWDIRYRLVKADEINSELEKDGHPTRVQHNWLVAEVHKSKARDYCSYVISTSEEEIITSLSAFKSFGVSRDNPHLQNPDFQSEQGAIKWLNLDNPQEPQGGHLFLNGQIYHFKHAGTTRDNFWGKTEGITIQLNNIDYQVSIDRPPLNGWDLRKHLQPLIDSMSRDDLIQQLKHSEQLWGSIPPRSSTTEQYACFLVIEKMVDALRWKHFQKEDFQNHFGDKPYLADERGLSESQYKELTEQGYVICPSYFSKLGMPLASSALDEVSVASSQKPRSPDFRLKRIAEEYGFKPGFETLEHLKTADEYFSTLKEVLSPLGPTCEKVDEASNEVTITLNKAVTAELLFHELPRTHPKNDEANALRGIRSAAFCGLTKHYLNDIVFCQGEYVANFGTNYDPLLEASVLLQRNVKCAQKGNPRLLLTLLPEHVEAFSKAFVVGTPKEAPLRSSQEESKQEEKAQKSGEEREDSESTETPHESPSTTPTTPHHHVESVDEKAVQELHEISIPAPKEQEKEIAVKRISRKLDLDKAEEARLAELEKNYPGLLQAVDSLSELSPKKSEDSLLTEDHPVRQYLCWRKSDDFYGKAAENASYISGKHLLDILADGNQAEIATVVNIRETKDAERKASALASKITEAVRRLCPEAKDIDEFELIYEPTQKQLAQLGILRNYAHLATGAAVPNDFFVFKGTGKKAINIGQKAIGIHEAVLETKLNENVNCVIHELGHNVAMDHGDLFRATVEALYTELLQRLEETNSRLTKGLELSKEDKARLALLAEWDALS